MVIRRTKMEIKIEKNEKELKLLPVGRLDSATAGAFQEAIDVNFTAEFEKLLIDFSGVDFISSKGLRVIVATYKSLNGRTFEICNANASVTEVLRLSGLLKVITVK